MRQRYRVVWVALWCVACSGTYTSDFKTVDRRGVIAASAGNHALGLTYHGQLLGISVTVVMPQFAPLIKLLDTLQENTTRVGFTF